MGMSDLINKYKVPLIAGVIVISLLANNIRIRLKYKEEPVVTKEEVIEVVEVEDLVETVTELGIEVIGQSDKEFYKITSETPKALSWNAKHKVLYHNEEFEVANYAKDYYDEHMTDDETHYIINKEAETVTIVKMDGQSLSVGVAKYKMGMEHSEDDLMYVIPYERYVVYSTGEIEHREW